jgi:NTE family protein
MGSAQLQDVMSSLDYRRFRDPNTLDHFGKIGEAMSVFLHDGIYRGEYLREWLTKQLAGIGPSGVRTFADLTIEDPGSDLPPDRAYKLVVMTSDISAGTLCRLPWDYPEMGVDAKSQPVADAVRMSMSIPFFYEPYRFQGRCFVDGGMLSNFPVDCFDRTDGKTPRWPTFGIKLSARPDANQKPSPIGGPIGMLKAMVGTMTNWHDQMHLDKPSVLARTIFVDCGKVNATDFDLDKATQDMLYQNGRAAAEKFLSTWNFEEYVQTYRSQDAAGVGSN